VSCFTDEFAPTRHDCFADQSKFKYDASRRTISVSPILQWFGEDFGSSEADRVQAIGPYLPHAEAQRLATSGEARISYLDYDWSLNDQTRAARR
jgi:hypothetical protein